MSETRFSPGQTCQVPGFDEVILPSLLECYGIRANKFRRLPGYDDRNYHVTACGSLNTNPHLAKLHPQGYILKISNSLEGAVDGLLGTVFTMKYFWCNQI